MDYSLVDKYNVAVPRYTSYPAVPFWDNHELSGETWLQQVLQTFEENDEISLYIHLPYCESLCTYCGCNKHITKNHLVEEPYINAVLKEWRMYTKRLPRKAKLRELHLGGGTPTFFNPENLSTLIAGILAECEVADDHAFSFEAHPFSTTRGHLEALVKLGFNRLSLGIQDFDEHILSLINRFQTLEQVERICADARELGYASINFDLIYGLPQQNSGHIAENLRQVARLKPDRIAFYSYAHVPDVAKGQRAYSEDDLPKGQEKWLLYRQARAAFLELGYTEIGMDHFALPEDQLSISHERQELHRNFMGYTPYHTKLAIALGASGISDSWSAFVQNEKTIKEYLRRVNSEDYPPLIKSHYLSNKEQETRARLLELICHFRGDWSDQAQYFEEFLQERFALLQADGLLEIQGYKVQVSALGRSFIRNICSVLDESLSSSQLQKPTFSKAV